MNAAEGSVQIPRLAVAYVFVEHERLVLSKHAHGVYAGVDTVRQRKVYNSVFGAEGYRRFCYVAGKGEKAAALSAGKQHSYALFFS